MRASEIGKWSEYDYVIVNEDLDRSFPMARAILAAERLKRERVAGLAGFVDGLSEGSARQPSGRPAQRRSA